MAVMLPSTSQRPYRVSQLPAGNVGWHCVRQTSLTAIGPVSATAIVAGGGGGGLRWLSKPGGLQYLGGPASYIIWPYIGIGNGL